MDGQRNALALRSGGLKLGLVGVAVAFAACSPRVQPDVATTPTGRASGLISDQANSAGTAGFAWIPPMVTSAPSGFTTLDQTGAANSLTVRIDRLYADLSIDPAAKAIFTGIGITMVTGTSSTSFPGVTGPFYGVNWAPGAAVASGDVYRVSIQALTAPTRALGVADVQVVATAAAAAAVDRTKFTPLVTGNTLAIVFRLENKDGDGDTINDWLDNCPITKNVNQLDSDSDGKGDACHCLNVPNGTACSTGCKTGMTCTAGVCGGGTNVANGVACKTGNLCKQTEICTSGVCGGGSNKANATACTTGNPCKQTETCTTGVCGGGGNKGNGTACATGNVCKTAEVCTSGACGGGSNKATGTACSTTGNTCTSGQTCSSTGTCTGTATNKANGTVCGDGNLCTLADTCQTGVCTGASSVACVSNACHAVGTCNKGTGVCPAIVAVNTPCPDGNLCNGSELCNAAGVCQPGTSVVCPAPTACHTAGTCAPATGVCSNPVAAVNTPCPDGNLCNGNELCNATGVCQPGTSVVCPAPTACHTAGTCAPATGVCSNPVAAANTPCPDGNLCNGNELCNATGVCQPGTTVVCPAPTACHTAGTCAPATGVCSNPVAAVNTPCPDANLCNGNEVCNATGVCQAGTPVTCSAPAACHSAGACDPNTGVCSNPALADGTLCDDQNACSSNDKCTAGVCGGSSPTCSGEVEMRPGGDVGWMLYDVWGSSANDIYVRNWNTKMLHRGPTGVVTDVPMDGAYGGRVWGSSATDIYSPLGSSVMHSGGNDAWVEEHTSAPGALVGIWGSSGGDVYAVGSNASIVHRTADGLWHVESTPLPASASLVAIRGSGPADVYAVGSDANTGLGYVLHRGSDNVWRQPAALLNPPYGCCSNVWANSPTDVYLVGSFGTILHLDASGQWSNQSLPTNSSLNHIYAIWAPPSGTPIFIAASQSIGANQGGSILKSTGNGAWTSVFVAAQTYLSSLWGDSPTSLWLVGQGPNTVGSTYETHLTHVTLDGNTCDAWPDDNPCTVSTCDPTGGVMQNPVTIPTACDDGNPCTQADQCSAGVCQPGIPLPDGTSCGDSASANTCQWDYAPSRTSTHPARFLAARSLLRRQ